MKIIFHIIYMWIVIIYLQLSTYFFSKLLSTILFVFLKYTFFWVITVIYFINWIFKIISGNKHFFAHDMQTILLLMEHFAPKSFAKSSLSSLVVDTVSLCTNRPVSNRNTQKTTRCKKCIIWISILIIDFKISNIFIIFVLFHDEQW